MSSGRTDPGVWVDGEKAASLRCFFWVYLKKKTTKNLNNICFFVGFTVVLYVFLMVFGSFYVFFVGILCFNRLYSVLFAMFSFGATGLKYVFF